MQPEALQNTLALCKLFLDENRLKILGSLAQQPYSLQELAGELGLKENLASRHLIKLVEVGLVRTYLEDQQTWYQLDLEFLNRLKKDLFALEAANASAADEDEADKVLRSYLEGEQLTQIPAKHSKRMVILAWLAGKFEDDIKYPEKEVNQILNRYHPDHATLRRALVDHGFMQREGGQYWRVSLHQSQT